MKEKFLRNFMSKFKKKHIEETLQYKDINRAKYYLKYLEI